jgi:hypothetical protein
MATEPQILSDVMDKTRQLTAYYMNFLKQTDLHKVFEIEGKRLNSAFWIMAHLAVTENFLLLRSTGGDHVKIPWARQFGLGSVPPAPGDCPPIDEVNQLLQQIHEKSLKHIASLDPEILDQENSTGFTFDGDKSIRSAVVHAIRHEGSHAGHLGWLCKLNGIKTL